MSVTNSAINADDVLRSGQAALERGDFAGAVATFSALTKDRPRAMIAWCGRAAAFYGANDFPRALLAAKRAIELAPADARGFFVLAPPAFVLGDEAAIESCRKFIAALARDRGREMAAFWARRLSDKDYFVEAAAAFDAFARAHPDDLEILCQRIDLLLNAFRIDDAAAAIARAKNVGAAAGRIDALSSRLHLARGEIDAANEAARRALAADPDCIAAYAVLAEADPATLTADAEGRLQALAADGGLLAQSRIVAGFALARVREARGEFDAAFAAYASAKKLVAETLARAGVRYDPRAAEAAARSEVARPRAPAPKNSGEPAPRLLFIIGMPRSGSTLVEQILARHSAVASVGESLIVPRLADRLRRSGAPGGYEESLGPERAGFRDAYRMSCGGADLVVDKNLFNFLHCRLIDALDPSARFVLCLRDPMDVGLSVFRTNFMAGHAWANDFDDIAHMIACFEFLADHWRRVFADRLFVIRHEDLVADFETGVRALVDFCGLPFEPACLDFHEAGRAVFTQSAAQVRRPLNADGVARWRAYERHLDGFRRSLETHRRRFHAQA